MMGEILAKVNSYRLGSLFSYICSCASFILFVLQGHNEATTPPRALLKIISPLPPFSNNHPLFLLFCKKIRIYGSQ